MASMNWPDRGPRPMRAYSVTCSSAILRTMALSELFLVNCCGPLSGRLASLANHVFANDGPPSCVSSLASLSTLSRNPLQVLRQRSPRRHSIQIADRLSGSLIAPPNWRKWHVPLLLVHWLYCEELQASEKLC